MIYLVLLVSIIMAYIGIPKIEKDIGKAKKTFVFIAFLLIFLVCVLRKYTVGRDIPGYRQVYLSVYSQIHGDISAFFHSVVSGDYGASSFEKGYMFLMYLCGCLGLSFQWFLVVCYLIMLIPIAVLINKYSNNVLLSVIVFVCYMFFDFYMTGLRQALSVSIVLVGIMFYLNFERKRWFRLLMLYLFIGIAFLFHQGAIIAIFIPVVSIIKKPVLSLAVCILLYSMLLSFKGAIQTISQLFSNGNDFDEGRIGYFGINAMVLCVITVVLMSLNYLEERRGISGRNDGIVILTRKQDPLLINMLLISIVLTVYLGMNTAARMQMYYSISLIISIPMVLKYFSKKAAKVINAVFIFFLIGYFSFVLFSGGTFDIYPYTFCWE